MYKETKIGATLMIQAQASIIEYSIYNYQSMKKEIALR